MKIPELVKILSNSAKKNNIDGVVCSVKKFLKSKEILVKILLQ